MARDQKFLCHLPCYEFFYPFLFRYPSFRFPSGERWRRGGANACQSYSNRIKIKRYPDRAKKWIARLTDDDKIWTIIGRDDLQYFVPQIGTA